MASRDMTRTYLKTTFETSGYSGSDTTDSGIEVGKEEIFHQQVLTVHTHITLSQALQFISINSIKLASNSNTFQLLRNLVV